MKRKRIIGFLWLLVVSEVILCVATYYLYPQAVLTRKEQQDLFLWYAENDQVSFTKNRMALTTPIMKFPKKDPVFEISEIWHYDRSGTYQAKSYSLEFYSRESEEQEQDREEKLKELEPGPEPEQKEPENFKGKINI